MNSERLARKSLSADAATSVVGGTSAMLLSPVLAPALGIRRSVVAAVGAGTAVWGGWVFLAAGGPRWQTPTRVVATVNAVAAVGTGLTALTRRTRFARWTLGLTAVELAAHSAVQHLALALDRRHSSAPGADEEGSPAAGDEAIIVAWAALEPEAGSDGAGQDELGTLIAGQTAEAVAAHPEEAGEDSDGPTVPEDDFRA